MNFKDSSAVAKEPLTFLMYHKTSYKNVKRVVQQDSTSNIERLEINCFLYRHLYALVCTCDH